MVRVAITGGPGSGKSMVRSFFEHLGAHAIDLDVLAREVVEPGLAPFREIVTRFGEEIVSRDGNLDRNALRRRILDDPQAKIALEAITHPAIQRLLEKRLALLESCEPDAVVVVEVPLLVEVGMEDRFDVIVLVDADAKVRKKRIMKRDRCSEKEAEALLGLHLSAKKKGAKAQFIIENTGAVEQTRFRVKTVLGEIRQRFSKTLTC